MAGMAIAVFVAWANDAVAQGKPTPVPGPVLTAPVAQGSTDVPYPKGAQGDAVVLLELTVEKDGSVARAIVTGGVEPFAEQARRAVLAWRFTPALRGNAPLVARIRARVAFHQVETLAAHGGAPATPTEDSTSTTLAAQASDRTTGGSERPRHSKGDRPDDALGDRRSRNARCFRRSVPRDRGAAGRRPSGQRASVLLHPRSPAERQRILRRRDPSAPAVSRGKRRRGHPPWRSSIMSTSIRAPRRPATEGSQARPSRVRRASRRAHRTVK